MFQDCPKSFGIVGLQPDNSTLNVEAVCGVVSVVVFEFVVVFVEDGVDVFCGLTF